jgi:hypothetical protein
MALSPARLWEGPYPEPLSNGWAISGLLRLDLDRLGLHARMDVGVTLGNLDSNSFIQLELPFDRRPAGALDATLDEVRDRFRSAAITRAVLLGRDQGVSVPLLPD